MNEREIIKRAKEKYKLGARRFEKVIELDCVIAMPYNRTHQHHLSREKSWSRGGEFQRADTDNSILLVDQMVEMYVDILPMRALILDDGSQFGAHRRGDNKEGVGIADSSGMLNRVG